LLLVTVSFVTSQDEPGSNLQTIFLKAFNNRTRATWSPVLKDVVNHEAPGDSNPYNDLVTLAHETSHGIHAYIRNRLNPDPRVKVNGFYILNNTAVIVTEPKMRKRQVAPFVPLSLRGDRYKLYIEGQVAWDDRPLYIFDEWVCYVNGGATGVDLVNHDLWRYGWRDAVAGGIEFLSYALATMQAVSVHDPTYFANYKQFTEFIAVETKQTMAMYKAGYKMPSFIWDRQEKLYANLVNGTDAASLRNITRNTFGADWTLRVIGF